MPTPFDLPLRLIVRRPLEDVRYALQLRDAELLSATETSTDAITFDFAIRCETLHESRPPRLLGSAVHGPPSRRYLYVNSGTRAGQTDSCWDRRAKVPLGAITPDLVAAVRNSTDCRLLVEIEGIARDGGPTCGTVSRLDDWRLVES